MLSYNVKDTPIGTIAIGADDEAILWLEFTLDEIPADKFIRHDTPVIHNAFNQLNEYLSGTRKVFSIALNPNGTAFQRKVWDVMKSIPYGQTMSYGEVAARINHPRAARAVGGAARINPIPIFIPCHRIIAFNGTLGGFSGGLDMKRKLLTLEGLTRYQSL